MPKFKLKSKFKPTLRQIIRPRGSQTRWAQGFIAQKQLS